MYNKIQHFISIRLTRQCRKIATLNTETIREASTHFKEIQFSLISFASTKRKALIQHRFPTAKGNQRKRCRLLFLLDFRSFFSPLHSHSIRLYAFPLGFPWHRCASDSPRDLPTFEISCPTPPPFTLDNHLSRPKTRGPLPVERFQRLWSALGLGYEAFPNSRHTHRISMKFSFGSPKSRFASFAEIPIYRKVTCDDVPSTTSRTSLNFG